MFPEPKPKKLNYALTGSLIAHGALVLLLAFYRPSPIFVTPSSLAMGHGDKSYKLVYFAPVGATNQPEPEEQKTLLAQKSKLNLARKHKQQMLQQQANIAKQIDENNKDARAGSEYGSLFAGNYEGHDVKPAYPVVYPDPPVARWEIPEGFQGDVVVEVSIDKLGNVIDLKLLQGIGHGVDEKVMATLRNWRYKPATMDGEPIAEKHDVHFHYPG
jgi:periplasmic protein TonB